MFGIDPAGPAPDQDDADASYTAESMTRRMAAIERAVSTGEPWEVEVEIRRPDGGLRWNLQRGVVDKDAAGTVIGYHGTSLDITERKLAEEERRVADARMRQLFDTNIVGTHISEADGRVIEANDYWLRLAGFTREELDRGEASWRAVTPPESLAADDRGLEEVRERGRSDPYEKEYLRRDGTRVPVLIVIAAMPGPGGLVASFALDMTERREAAAGLARLAAAIEQTSESVVITDLGGQIVYVNPAFERVTGYTRAEATGQNPRFLKSGVHAAGVLRGDVGDAGRR